MSPPGRHWWPEPSALRWEGEVTQEPGLVVVTQSRGTKGIKNTHKREERARSGAQREEEGHEVSLGAGRGRRSTDSGDQGARRPRGLDSCVCLCARRGPLSTSTPTTLTVRRETARRRWPTGSHKCDQAPLFPPLLLPPPGRGCLPSEGRVAPGAE